MTVTTNTSIPAAVFTDETLSKAAGLAADFYRPVWIGQSGEESSGESVARHLEATVALLDITALLRAGARFARTHGPRPTAGQAA